MTTFGLSLPRGGCGSSGHHRGGSSNVRPITPSKGFAMWGGLSQRRAPREGDGDERSLGGAVDRRSPGVPEDHGESDRGEGGGEAGPGADDDHRGDEGGHGDDRGDDVDLAGDG